MDASSTKNARAFTSIASAFPVKASGQELIGRVGEQPRGVGDIDQIDAVRDDQAADSFNERLSISTVSRTASKSGTSPKIMPAMAP